PLPSVVAVAIGVLPPLRNRSIFTPLSGVSSAEKLLPVMSVYFVPEIVMFLKLSKFFPPALVPLVATMLYPAWSPVWFVSGGTSSCTMYAPALRFALPFLPLPSVVAVAIGVLPPLRNRSIFTPLSGVSSAEKLLPVMSVYFVPEIVMFLKLPK